MIICPKMDIKKLKKRVNKNKLLISKKEIGIERYTQFTTVTLIYEKST